MRCEYYQVRTGEEKRMRGIEEDRVKRDDRILILIRARWVVD